MKPERWLLAAIAVLMLTIVAAIAITPLVIARDEIADRLESEIAALTGHEVEFDRDIDIDFLPVPRVTIRDLELTSSEAPEAEPLLLAQSLKTDLALLSALTGNARFSDFHLTKPILTLEIYGDGTTSWTSEEGRIAQTAEIAAENAKARLEEEADEPAPVQPLPMTPLGVVTIDDGTISIVRDGHREALSAINGQFSWPRLGMGAELQMAAVLRGEPVRLTADTEQPADLIAGNVAPFRFDFTSELLKTNFAGTLGIKGGPALTGDFRLSSPSARRAFRWSGTAVPPGEAIGALELQAHLETGTGQIRLKELVLNIDDNRGIGALNIGWPDGSRPVVAGTLAYETLDIGGFLGAFAPLELGGESVAPRIDTAFLHQLGLDLRLSAGSARLGPLTFADLAVTARIEEGHAFFDVGTASLNGGLVDGRIVISEDGFDGGGEMQFSASNIGFGPIFEAFDLTGPLPRGTGSVDLSLVTEKPLWATSIRDLTGRIELAMRDGVVPALDLGRFRELAASERFFALSAASKGEVPFRRAMLEASFADGTAEIHRGEIRSPAALIVLSGIVPYHRGGLAMTGALMAPVRPEGSDEAEGSVLQDALAPSPDPGAGPPLRFFIGGSWPEPVISPIVVD